MRSLNSENQILKTDVRGRVRTPRERREALLAEFATSGTSAAQFAKLTGINYQTFAGWLAKARRERCAQPEAKPANAGVEKIALTRPPVRLLEAVLGPANGKASAAGLSLELPGGARTMLESPLQLRLAAELLGLLARTSPFSGPSHVER